MNSFIKHRQNGEPLSFTPPVHTDRPRPPLTMSNDSRRSGSPATTVRTTETPRIELNPQNAPVLPPREKPA